MNILIEINISVYSLIKESGIRLMYIYIRRWEGYVSIP